MLLTDREILLRIKRKYSSDEEIKVLLQKIADLEIEVGVLKSEKAELEDMLKVKKPKDWQKDDVVIELNKRNQAQRQKNKLLEKQMIIWRDKYFDLANKQPNDQRIHHRTSED